MTAIVPRDERCEIPRCRREYSLTYYGRRVCQRCWNEYMDDANGFAKLRRVLKIPDSEE